MSLLQPERSARIPFLHSMFLVYQLHFHAFILTRSPIPLEDSIYCPGAMSWPFFEASCDQPPANASPPFFWEKSFILASSSGLK